MFTGRKKNVAHWIGHPNFMLIVHDVVEPIMLEGGGALAPNNKPSVDQIYHLACPARPPALPVQPHQDDQDFGHGHHQHARAWLAYVKARILLTSTSEVRRRTRRNPQAHYQTQFLLSSRHRDDSLTPPLFTPLTAPTAPCTTHSPSPLARPLNARCSPHS